MEKQSDIQETGAAGSGAQGNVGQGNGAGASKKKNNKPIIIFFILIIAALAGVIVWLLFFRDTGEVSDDRMLFVNEENKDTISKQLEDKVAKGMFECRMSMTWNFTGGGQGTSDAYVANSEHNTYAIYFDVIDNESGENLYSSPYIMVGSEISGFLLEKKLSAGSHQATVMYTLVDQNNDYEKISSAGFIVTMNVAD